MRASILFAGLIVLALAGLCGFLFFGDGCPPQDDDYDAHGRVTQKRDTHSTGRVFTVNYAWNATTGRLTSITYPKGKVLTFGYDAAGRVTSLTVGSAIIATNIAYFPFGAPSGWTWGNSLAVARSFDLDGRLTGFPLTTTDSRNITYDAASRITEIKHPTNSALVQTMGYDQLDRLTSWVDASSTRNYGYDANGNRTTLTIGANNYTYATPATTNRLGSTSGPAPARTFAYNGAGDTTGDGQFTLTYNDRGRLIQAVKGSTTATYTLDGLGQRVKKTGPTSIVTSGTNYFVYDEQGKLLGEYNSSGALIQEYVWLGTMPIAVLRGSTTSPTIFYIYADQIDRPWVITNTANQLRWRWDTSSFGELAANQNPAGLGNFAFNLRFPGQYLDKETGLLYNGARDYDPQTGRYVQSDPIGLAGGMNTYLYVNGNPAGNADPRGLYCVSGNGGTTCFIPGGPTFRVPTPKNGFPSTLGPDSFGYHGYDVQRAIGCADPQDVMQGLINSPTPGNPSPATSSGTPNNAQVFPGVDNPVTSYLTNDLVTGAPLVVNIAGTGSGAQFGPGYVVRFVRNGVAHTMGEGLNFQQDPNVTSKLVQTIGLEVVWGSQMSRIISQCGCKK